MRMATEIAERGKPVSQARKSLTDGDYIKNCMLIMAEDVFPDKIEQCKYISLSPNTVARKVEIIACNFSAQLTENESKFLRFSIALEGLQISSLTPLRRVNREFEVSEGLADLISSHGTTTGEDIFKEVQESSAERYNLGLSRLKCLTTDRGEKYVWRKAQIRISLED
ncbi:hypothetical protein PR048_019616 [Dryococelus australis]|uniref:Uncharacterized protein n=1 Tax=Dryococelus australis TaxID=614101 RepID=A0ABQ9H430_9NEOP|nr:hypothetical protein PR048_019616 [Dryococelus australis]